MSLEAGLRFSLAGLAALALAGCRAFPVGVLVPDTALDALSDPGFEERLDEDELEDELTRRAGVGVRAARAGSRERYWRLDAEPVAGPLAPEAFEHAEEGRAGAGLMPGDLVLVKNPTAQSLATKLVLVESTLYDHVGVLVEDEGRLFVCDSWPRFHALVKAEDFADHFRGGVRALPLGDFLAQYETLLAVRLPDPARNARLAAAALDSLEEGIRFDPHHDPADPRLSCSEYVQMLLGRAGDASELEPRAVAQDGELRRALEALGFPTTGFLVPDQFAALPGARPVAWISRHRTRAGARAVEAALALLHRRSLAGARPAEFLAVDRFRFLRYRANVALFLVLAEGWAEARGVEESARLEEELEPLLPLFFRRGDDVRPASVAIVAPARDG